MTCPRCGGAGALKVIADYRPGFGLLPPMTLYRVTCASCSYHGSGPTEEAASRNFAEDTIRQAAIRGDDVQAWERILEERALLSATNKQKRLGD